MTLEACIHCSLLPVRSRLHAIMVSLFPTLADIAQSALEELLIDGALRVRNWEVLQVRFSSFSLWCLYMSLDLLSVGSIVCNLNSNAVAFVNARVSHSRCITGLKEEWGYPLERLSLFEPATGCNGCNHCTESGVC